MSEPVYWISVDCDHPLDAEELQRLGESIKEGLDHEIILTTKEIEPLDRDELKAWIDDLQEAIE